MLFGLLTLATPDQPAPPAFVKMLTDPKGAITMQTAAHRLHVEGKPDVWLVGVAHIGEKSYYGSIEQLLDSNDEVLYEGVRKDDKAGEPFKPAPKPANSKAPAAEKSLYQVLSDALKLDFQLNDINYNHPRWYNTDLSMADLERINKEKGGGKPTGFDTIARMLSPGSPESKQIASFMQMASPGMLEAFKYLLVKKLGTADADAQMFDKPTQEVILTARNDAVGRGFAKVIADSQPPKSIAIFYGALHQADLEKALITKYGYVDVEQRWFTAAHADTSKIDDSGRQFLQMVGAMDGQKPAAKH
jgi:hypothetical protein